MHLRVYRNKHYSNILVCFVSVLNNIEENAFWGTTMPRPVGERARDLLEVKGENSFTQWHVPW